MCSATCARLAAKLRPIEAEVQGQLYNSTCFSTYRPNKPALGVAILEFLNDVGASKTANCSPSARAAPGLTGHLPISAQIQLGRSVTSTALCRWEPRRIASLAGVS